MAKDYARRFYQSAAWTRTQAAYMASQHYICERCGGLARVVHHRRYITPQNISDPYITLDWANLESLCMECHNREHTGGAACAEGLRFDPEGNLISSGEKIHPPAPPQCRLHRNR